jgi:general secretion pathway protein F
VAASISLEELVALNDEIAGLVRSGVPLELGLAGWGRSLPGKLGRIATKLGQSVAQGKSLPQSLDESGANFPPVYRAIVTAGIRSGRLPAALESLAVSARNLREVRQSVGLAVLYPLVLILLAYFAFWLVLTEFTPALLSVYEGQPPAFWTAVAEVGQWANAGVPIPLTEIVIAAGWIPPLVFAGVVALAWLSSRSAAALGGTASGWWLDRIPYAGRAVREARLAALAEILGLLVEQGVALDEAVVLAAESTADRRLVRTAHGLADLLKQGGSPPTAEQLAGFPPLLAWLVSSGGRQQTFVTVARHVADTYRRRVARDAHWLREYLPVWLVVIVGGGLVAWLGVATFLPFSQLMQDLGENFGNSLRVRP